MDSERRQHRRLSIRLPLEVYPAASGKERALRTVTNNIGTGGLYFEVDLIDGVAAPEPRELFNVELTVPPGDGHFPYQGRLTGTVEVIRCESLPESRASRSTCPRLGVAAQFREGLKLAF